MLLELSHLYLIALLPINHIIAYITMAYTGVSWEMFDVKS